MQYALDTNIVIHLLHGTTAVREARDDALKKGAKLLIPPFVNYEIMRAFLYQSAPKREAIYSKMKNSYAIGEMTTATWEKAAAVYASLRLASFTVGDADILIAAFCLVNGCTLVTNNTKDFKNISGLQLVDWTKVIEYDLTDEERALHSQGMAAYKANPDSFIPLDNMH